MCAEPHVINCSFTKNRESDFAYWLMIQLHETVLEETLLILWSWATTTRCFLLLPIDCFTSTPTDTNRVCSLGINLLNSAWERNFSGRTLQQETGIYSLCSLYCGFFTLHCDLFWPVFLQTAVDQSPNKVWIEAKFLVELKSSPRQRSHPLFFILACIK